MHGFHHSLPLPRKKKPSPFHRPSLHSCICNHRFLVLFSLSPFLEHIRCHLSKEFSSASSTTTVTSRVTKNGNAAVKKDLLDHDTLAAERGMVDDLFDETYREKEGPKPPLRYVWRNIILMSLLHLGAIIGLTMIPSAKIQTLAWGKHISLLVSQNLQTWLLGGIFFSLQDSRRKSKWRSSFRRCSASFIAS